ncbi:MAG: hypothetical protein Q8P50_11555 [Bacillota bacterium]|nr:hypothetical protein [Bacillota bacterium]
MRNEAPVFLGLVVGLVVIVSNFFRTPALTLVRTELDQWYLIALNFALLVGLINVSRIHVDKINKKKEGWPYSIALFVGILVFIVIGFVAGSASAPKFQWLFEATLDPMQSTMFSLLAFYIASAAYRAFRIRTKEATVLLLAATVIMLGSVPIGRMIWSFFPTARSWILSYPNTAGMRGIQVAAVLGGMATALRILLGIERGYLGGT